MSATEITQTPESLQQRVNELQAQIDALPAQKLAAIKAGDPDALARLNALTEVLPVQLAQAQADVIRLELAADEAQIAEYEAQAAALYPVRAQAEAEFEKAKAAMHQAQTEHLGMLQRAQIARDGAGYKRADLRRLYQEQGWPLNELYEQWGEHVSQTFRLLDADEARLQGVRA